MSHRTCFEAGFPLSIHKHTIDQVESALAPRAIVGHFAGSWLDDASQKAKEKYASPFPYAETALQ